MKKNFVNKVLLNVLHKPIQKIVDLMFNPNEFLVFVPEGGKSGNLYLDIHQALCLAKRENKKLILIRPYNTIHPTVNKAIFQCDFGELGYGSCKKRVFKVDLLKINLFVLSGLIKLAYTINRILRKLPPKGFFDLCVGSWYRFIRYGVDTKNLAEDLYPKLRGNEFPYGSDNFLDSHLNICLSQSQLSAGKKIQEEMGIPLDAKFVCLHVREPHFFNAPRHHIELSVNRNANILNYLLAIKFLKDQGLYVVRVGDPKMTPLPQMERVVDYAVSDFYSDLMEIYLAARCEFFIGSDTGLIHLPTIFRKSLCRINIVDHVGGFGVFPDTIILPKHVYSIKAKRFLSYREILENIISNFDDRITRSGYILVENTPDEILQCVKETFLYINKKNIDFNDKLQEEVRAVRQETINGLLSKDDISLFYKQRFRGRINNLGKVSITYLEKCWEYGPYLKCLGDQYNQQGFSEFIFKQSEN